MNITVTDITGSLVYILPHVPADIQYSSESENETVNTLDGLLRLVGDDGLTKVEWAGILPVNKDYSWQKFGSLIDGYEYIKFFSTMKKNKLPIRVVIVDSDFKTLLNKLMSIDTFNFKKDKAKDYTYNIALTEFPNDKWEFLNTMAINKKYLASLVVKSTAKKALKKVGIL